MTEQHCIRILVAERHAFKDAGGKRNLRDREIVFHVCEHLGDRIVHHYYCVIASLGKRHAGHVAVTRAGVKHDVARHHPPADPTKPVLLVLTKRDNPVHPVVNGNYRAQYFYYFTPILASKTGQLPADSATPSI